MSLERVYTLKFSKGISKRTILFISIRSGIILKFMARMNALTKEHLDMLWSSTEGKHEADERAVYELIIDMTQSLSNDVHLC